MGALDSITDLLLGAPTFGLKITSWRRLLHGCCPRADRQDLRNHGLEMECRATHRYEITVGSSPIEPVAELDFGISIHSAERARVEFERVDVASDLERDAVGFLMYSPPVNQEGLSGLPPSVIERAGRGKIEGHLFFANDSIKEAAHLLVERPDLETTLWISVKATSEPKPGYLTYQKGNYCPVTFHWNAEKNPLWATDVSAVFGFKKR